MDRELLEAFDNFDLQEAAKFGLDEDGIEEYTDFIDDEDDAVEETEIVDPEAETEEDVEEGSYLGDIALRCNTCRGIIAKKEEEVVTEDGKELAEVTEEDTVNAEDECPLCGNKTGFCVLGKIVPYVDVEVDVEEEGEKETEEVVEESCKGEGCEEKEAEEGEEDKDELQEAVNKFAGLQEDAKAEIDDEEGSAKVEIDDTKVDIDTKNTDELGLGPIDSDSAEVIEDEPAKEPEEEEDEEEIFDDVDINEIEEESLEMAYVKARPFCEKFRVRDVYHDSGKIVVEGIAKLRNGDRARTKFSLSPRILRGEKAIFVTEGLGMRDRCFGTLNKGKIVVESFKASRKNKR